MAAVDQAVQANDPIMRAEAMRVLGRSGVPELEAHLRHGASDPHPLVRAAAVEAQLSIRQNGGEHALLGRVASGEREERREALLLALRFGRQGFRERVTEQARRDANPDLRATAFRQALLAGTASDLLTDAFLETFLEDDPEFGGEAYRILIERGHAVTIERVQNGLVSGDVQERRWALSLLAYAPIPSTWPYLRWIHANGDEEDRQLATLALVRLGEAGAARDVLDLARRGPEDLTLPALRALRGVNDPGLREAFLDLMELPRPEVRRAVFDNLVEIGITPNTLLAFLSDGSPDLAHAARQRLLDEDSTYLTSRICPRLRMGGDVGRSLRFLWAAWTERPDPTIFADCSPALAALIEHDSPEIGGGAARLYYAISALPNISAEAALAQPSHRLYAFLDESIAREPRRFRDLYTALLDHELLAIRLVASIGLLKSGT